MSLRKAVELFIDVFDHNDVRTNSAVTNALNELRQAYAEPYKPMTDDEWCEWLDGGIPSGLSYSFYKELEAHILARLGIEVGK